MLHRRPPFTAARPSSARQAPRCLATPQQHAANGEACPAEASSAAAGGSPAGAGAARGPGVTAPSMSRRALLAAPPALALALAAALPPAAMAGQAAEVGSYLPPAPNAPGLVEFVPNPKKTPALRAGTVDPQNPYRVALPPSWREGLVANIQSGNYCQPRCAEPWTEVIFAGEEGKVQVVVAPLVRLTNQARARIEDVGPPAGVLNSLGSFITGTYLDEEDVVATRSEKLDDGLTYYQYEINAPYGTNGPHTLSAATTKGDLLLLCVVAANDKQWARHSDLLRQVVSTFRA